MSARYRLGIDIGGTFTDATLIDEASGALRIAKVSSTPSDPSIGFMEVAGRILRQAGIAASDTRYVGHATTVATNAIIEGRIARTAFITTQGFRDMLEIARQIRPRLYDLLFEKPRPLVPRYLCFGVRERLDAHGKVLKELDEGSVREIAARLNEEQVDAVAVCLLHSYVNPEHEKRVGAILREMLPKVLVSLSGEVAPEFREYLRASTTVINAAIRPVVSRYLQNIETRLRDAGLKAELLVMQSSGGVFTSKAAAERPVFMVESGPAAGVIASTHLGTTLGHRDVISFDMGGTTAKVGLIQDGAPRVTKDYQVGGSTRAGMAGLAANGYPIRTPVIDLVEIGAGGGSIAWIDSGGLLRVGPQSAGADPGPVCYGRDGREPTVTDANLVLGRLNPSYFLGGEIELDAERARAAIKQRCADRLGIGVTEAASGIIEIANQAMVNALHLISIQRGYDPRQFVLIAFGGAGPVHANRLAAEAEIPVTLIPMGPGIFSALGLLVTDLKRDYTVTLIRAASQVSPAQVEETFQKLERQGGADLEREGTPREAISFLRQADMRYVGQSYELTISLGAGPVDQAAIAELVARFHREHDRAYGYSALDEPAEFVNLRLTSIGRISKPKLRELRPDGTSPARPKATRPVYFAEASGYVGCPIYDRYRMPAGTVITGPAVVEELDSTTVIHPDYRASVDPYGNLLLTR